MVDFARAPYLHDNAVMNMLSVSLIGLALSFVRASADDWPQWRGPDRDGTWGETGVLESFPEDGLTIRWRAPLGGGYSGPSVARGRVYVMDRLVEPEEVERVHAFDAATGEVLWTHSYSAPYAGVQFPAGPRTSVLVEEGRAFSLGTTGHLFAFEAATGEVAWSHDLNDEYSIQMPVWGIAASPIFEDGLLIVPVSGKDACLVAFDARTGQEAWRALSDRGNYAAPIVIDQAGQRVVVCWTGDRVVGLDPLSGELYWAVDHTPKNMPLGVASPVFYEDKLFLTGFYDGSLLLAVDQEQLAVDVLWKRVGQNERSTDALHSIIATPLVRDGHIYGTDSYGELRCLRLSDGERVWEDLTAVPRVRWGTIHLVQNGEITWMFNERGELLRARLSPDGFEELDRASLIAPTTGQLQRRDGVCWSHPAFAERHVYVRNDEEIVCANLSATQAEND